MLLTAIAVHAGNLPLDPTFDSFSVSSDITARINTQSSGSVVVSDRSIIVIEPDGVGVGDEMALFEAQAGADVDGFNRHDDTFYYSLDTTRTVNGITFRPADIIAVQASSQQVVGLFFDAEGAGIPENVNLDAIALKPGSSPTLAVSFDTSFTHSLLGVVLPGDLVSISSGELAAVVFDGDLLPDGINVDAAQWVDDNFWLLSVDAYTRLPAADGDEVIVGGDDIVLYRTLSNTFKTVLDIRAVADPSWQRVNVDALWAQERVDAGAFRFTSSFREVPESIGTFDVTVERIDGSESAVQSRVTSANGTATAGSDFNPVDQVLSWADGDASSRTVTITIINDGAEEDNPKRFSLQLSVESGEADLASPSTLQVSILDNDGQNLFSDGFES